MVHDGEGLHTQGQTGGQGQDEAKLLRTYPTRREISKGLGIGYAGHDGQQCWRYRRQQHGCE